MSDGKRHHEVWRQNRIWVLPLSFISYLLLDPLGSYCFPWFCVANKVFAAVGVILGYFMGRYIDPDLDQMGATSADGRLVNEIPIIGVFLYGHWSTYGAFFRKHHRSIWTHFPVLSTSIRIIYQFYGLFIILFLKHWWNLPIISVFLGMLIGLSFADLLHYMEDLRSNEIRYRNRRR